MSFILEALKKAERERHRGAVPTLETPDIAGHADRPTLVLRWIVPCLLLVAAATGGWFLRPQMVALESPAPPAALVPSPPPLPATTSLAAAVAPAPAPPSAGTPTTPAPDTGEQPPPASNQVLAWEELPAFVRQEVPPLTLSLHYYAVQPAARMVMLNNRILHEGQTIQAGLWVDEIRPKDVVFRARGYRFTVEGVVVP